ncbi:toxin PIN [Alloprevotella rava]|uniref:Toxin PIN n=1 Tax=Alloprevotella rava TaxID=671218 RepID=A0A7W5YFN9_9BACT|nr:toxin PIN [Alloprevotella rava]MBB3702341.1 hypothetical protein [Alloprevotella rava]
MNNYIKPEIKVVPITLENSILTGSISVGISEDPATGPALSKGNNFFGDDDEEEDEGYAAPICRSKSLWDD